MAASRDRERPTAPRRARGWPPSAALHHAAATHATPLTATASAAAAHRRCWREARARFGAFRESAWLAPPSS